MLGRGITALTGSDVIQGVYAHRVLALCGVALIIWALPRLARRCDLDAGLVLWLGAANPLVLFHLVSGIHNEGLMIGLMLAGVELVLGALDRGSRVPARSAVRARRGGRLAGGRGRAPGAPGPGLRRDGRRRAGAAGGSRDVAVVAAVSGAIAAAVFVVLGVGTGLGFGWTRTLGTANVIRSRMSLATDLGQLSGQVGILAGLGDHTDTVLTITRGFGGLLAGLLCLRLLLLVLRGRLDPVTGLGVGLGAVVLLGPVVHPWYLLWAAIPLAATRGMPRHRRAALAASALLAVMLPPTGSDFAFRSFQLPLAILAGIVILAVALLVVRRELRAAGPAVPGNVLDDVGPTVVGGLGGAPLDGPPPRPPPGSRRCPGRTSRVRRPRPGPGRRPDESLDFPSVSPLPRRPDPGSAGPPVVSVRGLVKRYGSVTAVDGLDLALAPASVLALLGPNGAGKSTTVEVCTGFATADAGEVRVLGTDPAGAPEALRARIGVMPQGGGAYPGVRAAEMLGWSRRARRTRWTRPG